MTLFLNKFPFTEGADTVNEFDDTLQPLNIGSYEFVINAGGANALDGNDTIIAFGNYEVSSPDIVDDALLDIPVTRIAGIGIVDNDFDLGDRDDIVIGAAQLISIPETVGIVAGIFGLGGSDIDLGSGNDLVAGLASGGQAIAIGIQNVTIYTGSGNDTVVGGAVMQGPNDENAAVGILDTDINLGVGSKLVVGAAAALTTMDVNIEISGIADTDINGDLGDDRSDVILGIALGIAEGEGPEFTPYGGGMYNSSGISAGALTLSEAESDDIVVGLVSYTNDGPEASLIGNTGASAGHGILTAGGNDIVVGVVDADLGSYSYIEDNSGLSGLIETSSGADVVIGVVLVDTDGNADTFGNAGIGGFSSINTGTGADLVVGIADVSGSGAYVEGNFGIVVSGEFDTGDQDDIVIGLSQPLNGGEPLFTGPQNYGIIGQGAILVEDDDRSADIILSDVYLGEGDDFVYARGPSGGINGVRLNGEGGNDTFDIQSGFGEVFGGDDIDTLILIGNQGTYHFSADIPDADGPVSGAGWISGESTNIYVSDVEFFQFADGIATYDEVFGLA